MALRAPALTSNRLVYIPDKNGTIALTTDIPTDFVSKANGGTFDKSISIDAKGGTTTTVGTSYLTLGNSTAEGTAKNSKGAVQIFGKGTKYALLQATNVTGNRTIELPNATGTLALNTIIKYADAPVNTTATTVIEVSVASTGYKAVGATLIWSDAYGECMGAGATPVATLMTSRESVVITSASNVPFPAGKGLMLRVIYLATS